jgi:hypothetical protein
VKITREGRTRPLTTITSAFGGFGSVGPSGQVPTSNGSNGVSWGSNVAVISADNSPVLGPFVNFASGSNITLTIDRGPLNSTPSNTIRIHSTGGGSVSYGSNSMAVAEISSAGVASEVARYDHMHAGISTVTASSSNTMQRGTLNLRAGSGVVFSLSDTDGDGELDTLTFLSTASGGGGGGSTFTGHEDFWTPPDTAGTYDEEFNGAQDSLPSNWSWTTEPTGNWKLNSQWKRCLVFNRPASNSTTYELRRTSLTPGAIDIGFWWYMDLGLGYWNNNSEFIEVMFRDSGGGEGFGIRMTKTSALTVVSRSRTGGTTSDVSAENASNNDTTAGFFCGVTRKTSDNTWRAMISRDGRTWVHLNGTSVRSVTIDHMQVQFGSGGNNGVSRNIFGPLRSRNDLLLWAPR